jgi:hypothetical protein
MSAIKRWKKSKAYRITVKPTGKPIYTAKGYHQGKKALKVDVMATSKKDARTKICAKPDYKIVKVDKV